MTGKERTKFGLVGLIAGFIVGCGLNYLGLLLNNWLSTWTHIKPVEITIWSVSPLGILMGLAMGAAMMSGMFGD